VGRPVRALAGRAARRLTLAAALALAAPGAGTARAAGSATEVHAAVIGWNGGNATLPRLSYADDDAIRLALFFRGLAPAAAAGRVVLLTEADERTTATLRRAGITAAIDGPPTREAIRQALAGVARDLAARPRSGPRALYVVYAGHGLAGRVLLKPTHGEEAALTGSELRAALVEVAAADPTLQIFVFLDACRSESLFAERGAETSADFGAAIADLERRAGALSIGVLTAARSGRPAGEVRRLESGYFSHVLTSGLAGGADADGDDLVSFGELAAFVAFHTQKLTGQMPWFDPPRGDLQAPTIDHRGRRRRLWLGGPTAGRFVVGAAGGLPIFAEAYTDRGRTVKLALPAGHYLIRRESAGARTAEAAVALDGEPVDVAAAAWREVGATRGQQPPGTDADAEDGPAFSEAFSRDVVGTLAAGYHSGQAPAAIRAGGRRFGRLELGLGQSPLDLGGAEGRLGLRVGRSWGPVTLAGVGAVGRSRHAPAGQGYDLYRLGLGLELGLPISLARWTLLEPFVSAGWGAFIQRGPVRTSGDLRGGWAAPGLRLLADVAGPLVLSLGASYSVSLLTVDGRSRTTGGAALDAGMEVSF
jgi:hypothetical protein